MIDIPEKLKVDGIQFVILGDKGKAPIQKEWQNKKIYFDDEELVNHNGNYGVMGGGVKDLVVIDFDDEETQQAILPILPETFTVKTGGGLLHKYFYTNQGKSFKIFDKDMNTRADIQSVGKQVVGPGSIHPNGTRYEIFDDKAIAFLDFSEIQAIMMAFDDKPNRPELNVKKGYTGDGDDFLEQVKSAISMETLLSELGVDTSRKPGPCPMHDSKGGKCLGWTDEVAHCFHCDGAWNIFSMTMEAKNKDFKEALEWLVELAGLQDAHQKSRDDFKEKQIEEKTADFDDLQKEVYHAIACKDRDKATELLVNSILENNHIYTTRDDVKSEMWVYKEGIYVPQGKCFVKEFSRRVLGETYTTHIAGAVISKIETDTFIDTEEFFHQNQKNVYEVPVQNGILNVISRTVSDFTPEKVFFNKLPVEYNASATADKIDAFLESTLSSEDDKDVFYELGGFTLIKDYKFEKAFMFVGDGRNGKDKSLELIKRLLGIDNCCAIPLGSIVPDSFIISEFFGKMANLAGEISNTDLKITSEFKALTGRSLKSAPRKFLQPISFVNYAKFVFACNELPMVYDNSKGFWDRWVLLEFPYTFVTQTELDTAEDKTNLKLRDEDIIEKITTPTELSGLLNRFLDGLERLLQKKGFSSTKGSSEIKNFWIRKSNSVMAFCFDMIDDNYEGMISKKAFRKRYSKYCKDHQIPQKTDYVIKRTIEEMFGAIEGNMDVGSGKWERSWEGIQWKGSF